MLLSSRNGADNQRALGCCAATSGSSLPLAWLTSVGFAGMGSHQGLRQPARIRINSDCSSDETGDVFTGLGGVKKMFLCSHNRIFEYQIIRAYLESEMDIFIM